MDELFENLKKYNYWTKNTSDTGLKRHFYLDNLKDYLDNRLVKVFIGQRRSGKSYFMRQVIEGLIKSGVRGKNIFYLNKEFVDFEKINDYKKLIALIEKYKKELKPSGKVYLFLDEVQEIDKWEKLVNSYSQNHIEQYELFITGSNSNLLSGELATYLSGRYITFEIMPFSFDEYAEFFKLQKDKHNLTKYLRSGGLPELLRLPSEESRLHYVSSLKDTIILKDIVRRFNIKDVALLESIFLYICDTVGNLTSINNIVGYLNSHKHKTNIETVSNYIKYLAQTFLIHEVDRYDIKGKEILARNKKYYVNDLSFIIYLLSRFDQGIGKLLENIVYLHYKKQGYKIYVGKLYNEEVDFIIEKGQDKKYVQVSYLLSDKKVIEREFRSLEKIKDSYEKIVISLDEISIGNREGIKHLSIIDIL